MPLNSGTKLGPYEIRSPLGVGGMGEVYRAHDTTLNREVAIKVLPEGFARNAERMGRFAREAKVLASLNHPNIATIYRFEDPSAVHLLVMELVEGPTIADRLLRSPLPLAEALPIAKQVCEALEYAHDRGIVHRDLKPANVKVTPERAVKLLDFGLAIALEPEAAFADVANSPTLAYMATQAGIILGTAAYMSPEQAKGKNVDRRSDIWSFGCLFYEMLTGEKVFGGETVTDILASVIKSDPDWSLLPPNTAPSIRKLLQRCLKKDPKQRLQAIGEARIAIEETLSGEAEKAAPVIESINNGGLRKSRLIGAVAVLTAAGLLAGTAAWKWAAPSSATAMHFSAVTNFAGVQAQPALSPDGRSVAFVSNRDGHYNIYIGLISGGNLVQLTHDGTVVSRPRWSPDGTTISFSRLNASGIWDIWEVPALGGTPQRLMLSAKDADWSPNGHFLAYENLATESVWISDTSGQNARQVTHSEPSRGRDTEPRFSPSGRQLAYVSRPGGPYGELSVVNLESGKIRLLTHDAALALSPAWSPDGEYIYFASSRGGTMNIWKIAAGGGTPEQITAGQGDDAQLDVSRDGKRIVFSTFRENIHIVQLDLSAKPGEQQSERSLTGDPARNQLQPAYSPDGKRVAYFSNRKGAEKEGIWVANIDGSGTIQLARDDRLNLSPRWTSDGEHLIYSTQTSPEYPFGLQFRRVSVSGGAAQIVLSDAPDANVDVGRDGRLLFPGSEGKIQGFDPSNGQTDTLATAPSGQNWNTFRWSPDGRSIAYVRNASKEGDPNAGVWVDDLKSPPRQVFRGWAIWYAPAAQQRQIYVLGANPDLTAVFWKVGWNGEGLTRTSITVPLIYSYWSLSPDENNDYFDASPDGRHLAYNPQGMQQANIGMIENVR